MRSLGAPTGAVGQHAKGRHCYRGLRSVELAVNACRSATTRIAIKAIPTYWCGRRPLQRGESGLCQTVHGGALDGAISDIVIEAMTPLAIEVALTVQQELA